jgi:hypothetical protein
VDAETRFRSREKLGRSRLSIGVRNDLANKYRATGTCKPYNESIASCRGARGVNKGLRYCGTYDG